MSTDLTSSIFNDEGAARAHFEAIRWSNGPVCPHCGVFNKATLIRGKSHRPGMYQCNACLKPFTVTIGSIMELSHVPLTKWALAFHLMASSKNGISAHQLMRMLGLGSYRTAWFMAHRVREAMADRDPEPLGGKNKTMEADETFIGKPNMVFAGGKGWQHEPGTSTKHKVTTFTERGGQSVSIKVEDLTAQTIKTVLGAHVVLDSTLNSDEAQHYRKPGKKLAKREAANHGSGEYVRGKLRRKPLTGLFARI